jgi:uncharacterized protein
MSDAASGHKNHLAGSNSPYLLLHQDNPVDWYPWGEEALARARQEDRPIFLSVGYSTCYWCHVMERESFSDPEIAALMNRSFISIKVDREERPDLDEIYMTATQLLTGQGGWPNSVFLTPDLKPFYAGTYFPPRERFGRPGFASLLVSLADAWKNRRSQVEHHAEELAAAMQRHLEERAKPGEAPPGPGAAERSLALLKHRFDRRWGGFGSAPKFPTPSNLFQLLAVADADSEAAQMLAATLDQMARGGIYDQLGGGFHRYATDREWKVPHFEKMLYDNGLLLEVYARQVRRTRDPEIARAAAETAEFLAREMTSPEGGLWSAIDAETDGQEGAYYVWSRDELEAALGGEDAVFLAPIFGFDGKPFFEGDRYVLHLPRPLAEQAAARRLDRGELLAQIAPLKARLLAARDRRPRPLTDDKVLADWNGMAIAGLAEAGEALGEAELVARARRAARFVLARMRPGDGPLFHAWRGGRATIPAYLSDYAFLVRGLLTLYRVSGEATWLAAARELTEEQIRRLGDPAGGFYVAAAQPDVLFRSKDAFDGATPSPNGVAVDDLLELAAATGEERWRDEAARALAAFAPLVEQFPDALGTLALAARRYAEAGEAAAGTARPASAPAAGPLDAEAREVVAFDLDVAPAAGGWRPFHLTLRVASGWHVNANPASEEFLVPTAVAGEGAELRQVVYPPPERIRLAYAEGELAVYLGEATIRGEVQAATVDGRAGAATLVLTYQPCDATRCLPPVTRRLEVPRE